MATMSFEPKYGTVIVVSKPGCGYCVKAKALLTELGYTYTELDFMQMSESDQADLRRRVPGQLTFPQIFAGTSRIDGGCSGLQSMVSADVLDETMVVNGVTSTEF
jgi:glutaredoxin 3